MDRVKRFIYDFTGFFVILLGTVVIGIAELITQAVYVLQRLWDNGVKPLLVHLLVELNYFLNIVLQGFFEVSSNMSLFLSKMFYNWSEYFHNKSEEYISKNWQ